MGTKSLPSGNAKKPGRTIKEKRAAKKLKKGSGSTSS
jgi:hypothetical protein